jgi:hypothetical protein
MCTTMARPSRPHRHRHAQRVRPPDALRPERGLPAGDDQEGPPEVHHPRAAVVPAGLQRQQLAARSAASPSGTNGRARTATWARSTACSGAAGRRPTAATSTRSPKSSRRSRPTRIRAASSSAPGTWPTSRRWRWRPATRSSSSTWRRPKCGRQAVVPAVPAQRRHLPGRALQHRQLRAAHAHDGAACDLGVGDFIWTGGDCHIYSNHHEQVELQLSRQPFPYPHAAHQAQARIDLRLPVRGLRGAGLPVPRGHQGAGGGLSKP